MKKKILFINFGGLGDEILFLPTIISTKKEFPDSEITLALEPRSKGILSLTDIIDETLFADIKGRNKYIELFNLLRRIWNKKFDIVISSGSNKFISIFLFMTFIKERIGYNSGRLSEKLLTHAVRLNKNQYAAKMYHDLVKPLTDKITELPEINIEPRKTEPDTVLIHPLSYTYVPYQEPYSHTASHKYSSTPQLLPDFLLVQCHIPRVCRN